MLSFSRTSQERLSTCHIDLQTLFNEVIKYHDCSILCGYRSEIEQNKAYAEKRSQLKYPYSKHNSNPSIAADVAPYPIIWEDKNRFYYFAGFVEGVASGLYAQGKMNHKIRCGANWDGDNDLNDQTLFDLVHFQLVD